MTQKPDVYQNTYLIREPHSYADCAMAIALALGDPLMPPETLGRAVRRLSFLGRFDPRFYVVPWSWMLLAVGDLIKDSPLADASVRVGRLVAKADSNGVPPPPDENGAWFPDGVMVGSDRVSFGMYEEPYDPESHPATAALDAMVSPMAGAIAVLAVRDQQRHGWLDEALKYAAYREPSASFDAIRHMLWAARMLGRLPDDFLVEVVSSMMIAVNHRMPSISF